MMQSHYTVLDPLPAQDAIRCIVVYAFRTAQARSRFARRRAEMPIRHAAWYKRPNIQPLTFLRAMQKHI